MSKTERTRRPRLAAVAGSVRPEPPAGCPASAGEAEPLLGALEPMLRQILEELARLREGQDRLHDGQAAQQEVHAVLWATMDAIGRVTAASLARLELAVEALMPKLEDTAERSRICAELFDLSGGGKNFAAAWVTQENPEGAKRLGMNARKLGAWLSRNVGEVGAWRIERAPEPPCREGILYRVVQVMQLADSHESPQAGERAA